MSKYDAGKHPGMAAGGKAEPNTKRLDAQKPSPQLLARQASYAATVASLKSDASGFNKPGSQQKRSK